MVAPSGLLLPLLCVLVQVLYLPWMLREDGARGHGILLGCSNMLRTSDCGLEVGTLGESMEKHGTIVWVEAVKQRA
jgi:hypothetical protein